MPKNNETTTKFKIDISELKAGIQEANRQIRLANAEFKEASSGMDDWSKSTDGLNAKIKQLESVLQSENQKLENLKKQLTLVEKEQGANSKGADELRIAIANQQAAVNKTEKSLNGFKGELNKVEKAEKVAAKTGKDVAEVLEEMEKEAEETSDGFTVLKGTLSSLIADGVKSLASSIMGLVSDTREFRTEMAKLETAFETNGHSVESAKKTYEDLYAVLGDEGQTTEAVNFIAKMTHNEKDLAHWTEICTGVYGQFGNALPVESLTEAANETAKTGQLTGALADALNWAGVSEDKFQKSLDECNSESQRQKLIMQTLNGLYTESAEKYRENNKEVMAANKAQLDMTESLAKIGEIAEPVVTAIKQGFADMLRAALELAEGVDFTALAETIKEGFGDFIDNVLPKIVEGFKWIIDNKDILIAGIAGLGAAFVTMNVANMIMGLVQSFKAFKAAQEGATVAQWLLNAAMNANPIGLVVAAIVGLVAAFVILWNKSEAFRKFWIDCWQGIKDFAVACGKAIKEFFVGAWDGIKSAWSSTKTFFADIWSSIKQTFSDVKTWFVDLFTGAWEGIKNAWSGTKTFFSDTWSNIKNAFSKVGSWFKDTFQKAWDNVKDVFSGWGDFFGGLWNTIKNKFSDLGTSISNAVGNSMKAGINSIISGIEKAINKGISLINGAIDLINTIPGVEVGKISELSFPRLARGGVLKKGQVGLLEGSGTEAVVPLENNAKWIRKTAADLKTQLKNEGVFTNNNQSVVNNNYNYTQNNTSPKALSRLEIYRQTKNQLNFAMGGFKS